MNHIKIAETTLSDEKSTLSFKQKLEIARKLERLGVDAVELPEVGVSKADSLLVRTAASFVKGSVLSVAATTSVDAIDRAADALSTASHPRIRVELPMTASIMEYSLHIKQPKMCAYVKKLVASKKPSEPRWMPARPRSPCVMTRRSCCLMTSRHSLFV